MSTANLNIRVVHRRMLTQREAAEYLSIPAKRFQAECGVSPIAMPSGAKLYDRHDLDTWIDSLKSGDSSDDDAILSRLG